MEGENVDEKVILTYLSLIYHTFKEKKETESTSCDSRVGRIAIPKNIDSGKEPLMELLSPIIRKEDETKVDKVATDNTIPNLTDLMSNLTPLIYKDYIKHD